MIKNKKSLKKESWIFTGILFLLFVLFAWRQFYGFNKNDEIFYISMVHRFFQGDAMLIDEWNISQLFTFITYPLYSLIRIFHDSNEGIVLISRMFYLVFQAGTALYCYDRMRRFGWIRILPALFYFVTTPYNINALCYNTLAFGFVLLMLVTVASADNLRISDSILCGLFTAGAVLANPYIIVLFIGYGAVCVGTFLFCKNSDQEVPTALSVKNYFWMCVAAFVVLVLFVIFIFSRGSLKEILECLSYVVINPERQNNLWEKFLKYFIRIHRYYKVLVYMTGISIFLRIADRKRRIRPYVYLAVNLAAAIPYIIYYGFFWDMVGINYILIPMAFPGLIAYIISRKKERRLFFGWYVPALLYTLVAHFATNTGILTVSASYMIVSAASILLIWKAAEEWKKPWIKMLICVLLGCQFLSCFYQRVTFVWGDEELSSLDCRMTEGPLKGIYTSAENKQLYEDVLQDMEDLQLTKEDKLSIIGIAPWMYLNTEAECAAYSTWEILETDSLTMAYYELRPEKYPTVIYCYKYDDSILETEFAYHFMSMGYDPAAVRCGIVLVRR